MSHNEIGRPDQDVPLRLLSDEFHDLIDAALFAVRMVEEAWPIRDFDGLLETWIRETLDYERDSIVSADSQLDVSDDVSTVIALAFHYTELRRELFSDMHHYRPEPPWRPVGDPFRRQFAVRAASQARAAQPMFALRQISSEQWEFLVTAVDKHLPATVFALRITGHEPEHGRIAVCYPDELAIHPLWIDQLCYGFHALGYTAHVFPESPR
ncbi:hypothetical protein [Nocardia sp. NPDC052566]|uniref:hypothetical protein n=1 Tax=Nocardia sp. NPDC052566 TaxID=3364330 RepID=UPI0037CB0C92